MNGLATHHVQQMERISSDFFDDGDGLRAVARRTDTVDDIVGERFREEFGGAEGGVAAVAVGGYGRCEMFPHSDVDLLLLFSRAREAEQQRERIARLLTTLWDSKLRVSHSVRDPRECAKLMTDNAELHISLLDTRFVAGDRDFFKNFCRTTLPRFFLREQKAIQRMLSETARRRHGRFSRTIYHLEPDIKESPGGLRDYHLACWMAQLENVEQDRIPWSEEHLPRQRGWDIDEAKKFLFAVRCYLHFYFGRDKNLLSYDMQDAIAYASREQLFSGGRDSVDLMRSYFRNTRQMYGLALRLMEESAAPSNALLKILRGRTSRRSNRDFSVSKGKAYFQDPRALESTPALALGAFEFFARHGIPPARQTELRILARLPQLRQHFAAEGAYWPQFRQILLLPHAYRALEGMRDCGLLSAVLPEFELIDCLVIRNVHHRFTVDQHTLATVRVLKDLPGASDPIDARFASLLSEISGADLLYLALLFHDTGKGVEGRPHDEASAELAETAMRRIGVTGVEDRETVLHLVRHHGAMSVVMTKRDISETAVLDEFKGQIKTVERLRLLTLMTYADSSAVNPVSKGSWRKTLLWQLYLGVFAAFQRDHEDRRIQPGTEGDCLGLARSETERCQLRDFLGGFPERYVVTREPGQILEQFRMASALDRGQAGVSSRQVDGALEVVVLAPERPLLFASLCAAIASLGFNIQQAEAFSNENGMVLDTFRVTDGPAAASSEVDAAELAGFEQRLRRVAEGSLDGDELLRKRRGLRYQRRGSVETRVSFDNITSSRATIFYVQTADRVGLLYDLASAFSEHGCEVDLVLCETQDQRVNDVFYVRMDVRKLPEESCATVKQSLVDACERPSRR